MKGNRVIYYDLETTGLGRDDKIIEIAINIAIMLFARRPAGRPNTFSSIS